MNRAPHAEGEYYHLYNRGTDKREIFTDNHDHNRFMTLLYLCNSNQTVNIDHELRKGLTFPELFEIEKRAPLVSIGAYCLMPNHFHILVREEREGGIPLFMRKLSTAYTMYFNVKHSRNGALFQGTYRSKHVAGDEYLKYLFAYIHLNPVKLIDPTWKENGIVDRGNAKRYLEGYRYSSYGDYRGTARKEGVILSGGVFPEYFSEPNSFERFVADWLAFSES